MGAKNKDSSGVGNDHEEHSSKANINAPQGLTKAEVEERIARGEINSFKQKNTLSNFDIILRHFKDIANQIIFISVIFLFVYGQYEDALLVALVIGFNIVISVIQEISARNSLNKVSLVRDESVKVVRGGEVFAIKKETIVKDDIIYLESGKYLYVDGEVVSSDHLLLDESVLTGESDYIAKDSGDEMKSGSFVVSGNGYYRATKVGSESFVNKMTIEAKKYIDYYSPLQLHVRTIVKVMTYLALLLIFMLFTVNFLYENDSDAEIFNSMISIVSALVPQGMLLTVTIAFIVGVVKMYRKNILVQRSNAIEALASIRVLCMDKTGTLTKNELVLSDFVEITPPVSATATELIAIYCEYTLEKNKTIIAIAENDRFQMTPKLTQSVEVTRQIPFTSKNKYSGLEFIYEGRKIRVVLGSVDSLEAIVAKLPGYGELKEIESNFAAEGKRNLIFLVSDLGKVGTSKDANEAQAGEQTTKWKIEKEDSSEYSVLAIVSIRDTLRDGVNDILKSFIHRGVKPVIISGDSAQTLKALLKQLKIDVLDKVVTGAQLQAETNKFGKEELILGSDVFARTTPEQKLEIIEEYKKHYGRVAMIGDGVNDALAIKKSDLGIAMGEGASVTRNIADVILLDNDLSKLSEVIKEGKDILYNSLRSSQILIVKNFYSVFILMSSLLLGFVFPFNPRTLFLLSFVNANFPIWVLLTDSNDDLQEVDFMQRLLSFTFTGGILVGAISILVQYTLNEIYTDEQKIISIFISFLVLVGIVHYLEVLHKENSKYLSVFTNWRIGAAIVSLAIHLAFMYIPALAEFIGYVPVGIDIWFFLICVAIVYRFLFVLVRRELNKINWMKAIR